ncbi:MAG: carboxypeptidase-like regulatory domain-containing protein, partial [Chitinophagia bacterium]|nr:carboxypeptidase-like regulatory domain-containing protein [Chitinophagia bacterium]
MKHAFRLLLVLLLAGSAHAQTFSITGEVADAADSLGLINVSVRITGLSDSNFRTGTVTDADGNFAINNISDGTYKLTFSYVGYTTTERNVTIAGTNVDMGTIALTAGAKTLKNVTVTAKEIRASQNGDTTQFNANAYKT